MSIDERIGLKWADLIHLIREWLPFDKLCCYVESLNLKYYWKHLVVFRLSILFIQFTSQNTLSVFTKSFFSSLHIIVHCAKAKRNYSQYHMNIWNEQKMPIFSLLRFCDYRWRQRETAKWHGFAIHSTTDIQDTLAFKLNTV